VRFHGLILLAVGLVMMLALPPAAGAQSGEAGERGGTNAVIVRFENHEDAVALARVYGQEDGILVRRLNAVVVAGGRGPGVPGCEGGPVRGAGAGGAGGGDPR
jgi:hypothetical protein